MQIYFAGAESPSHLKVLREEGVERVAMNITAMSRRNKDVSKWASVARLEGLEWLMYADSPDTSWEAALSLLEGCEVPPEAVVGPLSWAEETYLGKGEILFLPMWDGTDRSQLRHFAEQFGGTFLPDSVVASAMAVRSAVAAMIGPSTILGALTGRSKNLEQFEVVVSSAWWSVQKHGETQVWDQGKLNRYNSDDKLARRSQHREAIIALGVDYDAVLADDSVHTTKLAIRSWQQLEQRLAAKGQLSLISSPVNPSEVTNSSSSHPSRRSSRPSGVASSSAISRHETATLPVIGLDKLVIKGSDADGNETSSEVETLTVNTQSLRKCDTCQLSMHCEGFEAGARCKFSIPVVIRSKDDLSNVLRAHVEIQSQKVMMMRYAEEITGVPDPDMGKETDRLFNIVGKWKEIEDNRDTMEMTVRAKGAGEGNMRMLSRLFGSKVGDNAMALRSPVSSDAVTTKLLDD